MYKMGPINQTALPAKYNSRKEEITGQFVEMAEKHIQELMDFTQARRFTAAEFGRRLFIHPVHLTNTLRLTLGISVCDYMEQRLIQEAEKLLRETDLSIAEVGMHFAYEDASNFTKFFKSMKGVTPREYRKQLAALGK